jgi:outer membrane protein assembly factor BamA
LSSAKRYGYSISPEGGVSIGASVERAARSLGADGDATFLRGDVRAYVPFGPRHAVLALRATGARTTGDAPVRRVLRLGGSDGDRAVLSFDEDASSLLRGFATGQFTGSRLALVNAEYRLPIAWIERGAGTWPIFLRSLHATLFADAGDAWRSGGARPGDWKGSWGGELSTDVVAGFVLPLTLTGGVAWGRDGESRVPPTRTAYVRLGHGF